VNGVSEVVRVEIVRAIEGWSVAMIIGSDMSKGTVSVASSSASSMSMGTVSSASWYIVEDEEELVDSSSLVRSFIEYRILGDFSARGSREASPGVTRMTVEVQFGWEVGCRGSNRVK
jgi:hypothetical protein